MNLEQTTTVTINNKAYEVALPTTGQQMDIENKKMFLSSNTYRDLVLTGTRSAKYNLLLIDALAAFTVLIPALGKDLGVDNYLDLPPFVGKEVVKAYKKDFYPWWQAFLKELYSGLDDEEETDEQASGETDSSASQGEQ